MSNEEIQQLHADYTDVIPTLSSVSGELDGLVGKLLDKSRRIDSIRYRVKEVESFIKKSQKLPASELALAMQRLNILKTRKK